MPSDTTRPTPEPIAGASGSTVRAGLVDVVIGLVLAAVACAFFLAAVGFDEVDNTGVGPATFPKAIAALLAITAALLAVRGAAGLMGLSADGTVHLGRPLFVLASIALVCAFPLLMTRLGYYLATAVWLPAFLLIAGYRRPLGILLCTADFLAFAKVAFELALGVRLP